MYHIWLANGGLVVVYVSQQRGYSLMVKLQPSKLIMRVRFPLPAYLNQHARMKKVLSMIMLAGMLAGPMYAAGLETVTAMAAPNSGVALDALSLAVYETIKASPERAVEVFQAVIKQRKSWSVTETYAILRAVLLASPALEVGFVQAATQSGTSDLGKQLYDALCFMPETSAVAAAVVQGVIGSSVVVRGGAPAAMDVYVPAPPAVSTSSPEYTVTPTPPPTSVNN